MPLALDRLQQRIIGVLIEKQFTTPDAYPLTVNALVSGCNQRSNRDPAMSVEAYEVQGALRALMDEGWVIEMDVAGGRTLRYEHRVQDQLGVEDADLALLAELLVRGPQAPGALKTRASRMQPFASPAAVESCLRALADHPVPFVEELPRRPRERQARWRHLLGAEAEVSEVSDEAPAVSESLEAPPAPYAPAHAPAPAAAPDRIEELERRIEDLASRLDRLEGR